jgi:hypothetical protein
MNLDEFIRNYNFQDTVIVLEGKRNVLDSDASLLILLGETLAKLLPLVVFRSGNAEGADELFSKGVEKVDPLRLHVLTPYSNYRARNNPDRKQYPLDAISLLKEPELVYQSAKNQQMKSQVERYANGVRDKGSMMAAYIIRDTAKIIGTSEIGKATVALFYEDLKNPLKGGTGHTIKTCKENNVPFFNQTTWMKWLV